MPNIFNLGYDLLGREGTTNYIYDKQKYIEHLNNYIMLNGTQEEQDAMIAISGITNAGMTLAEITALTALLGGDKTAGFIATTLMAGAPEGARLGLELTQQGMSYAQAKTWGVGAAVLIGGSEFVTNFNFMPKVLGGKQSLFSSWLIKRGTKSALARNIAGLGKLVDWTVATGIHVSANAVEESAQEGLQDLMMQTYEMLAKGDFTGYDLGRTWSAVKGGFETAPFLYAQGRVMNAAGNAVGGYIPLCEDQYPAMLALTNYGLGSHPDSKAYQEATKILSYKHKVTVGNMASLITAIEADAADPRIAKLNETLAQNAYSADKTVTSLFYGGLEGVDTTEVDQAKKEVGAAKHKLAEADSAYNTAAGQYLSVMQEDMQNGFLLTDAEHDMYLKFVEVAKKGLDSAKEVFSVLSEKFQQAKDGLDKLLSGIITTARAESDQTARSEILSEIADRQQESNTQKAGQFAEETVLMDQPSPVNVSIDGTTAGNDSNPLAPNDGSGIINEGAQGEDGYDAGDAGGADGQYTVSTIETFTQGSTIPDEVLKTKPLYSPDANK